MMKIKLTDIDDRTGWAYLKQNPEYSNQLVATLNQVNGFSSNQLRFVANSSYWIYDFWFSPNYDIDKEAFRISNDQIRIRSRNRDDLLNSHYYQHLNDLANNHPIADWSYFPQDQVLQVETSGWWSDQHLNVKLTKPIDQYNQNQLNAIGELLTNVYDLIIKDDELDWGQFADQWKQEFDLYEVRDVGIVFDLNDFANSKILLRWLDESNRDQYENDLLKNVLKADTPLLKFLNESDFATHFQPYQSKVNKFFKIFLD